jgi:hypothetical protein
MLKSQLINISVSADIHLAPCNSYTEQAAETTSWRELWIFPVGENDLRRRQGFH